MTELKVDIARFQELLPDSVRRQTVDRLYSVMGNREDFNREFFTRLNTYHRQPFPNPVLGLPDLYSPNICVIDFATRELVGEQILDYGCGFGLCGQYLSRMGFDVRGYDNWSQLPREMAEQFQSLCESPIQIDDTLEWKPSVVMHVSIWCSDRAAWDRPSVKWILSDTHYVPGSFDGTPEGFEHYAQYYDLLSVFKRVP